MLSFKFEKRTNFKTLKDVFQFNNIKFLRIYSNFNIKKTEELLK